MIRVALLSTYPARGVPAVGGVEAASQRLVEALVSRGVAVTVIGAGLPDSYEADGIHVLAASLDDRRALLRGYPRWRREARELLARLDVDVVHGQGLIPGGLAAAEATGVPRVVTAQGNVVQDTLAAYRGLGRRPRAFLRKRLATRVVTRADMLIAAHPDWRWNMPVRPSAFAYIPTVVDDAFFGGARDTVRGRVLFCGGGRRIKGFDVLARAWPSITKQVRDAHLVAVGFESKPEMPRSNGSSEIRGWLAPDALADEMRAASVLVIPSRFDVAPLAVAEAWAAQLPVIATDVGGLGPLAEGAAMIVPAEDATSLEGAVIRMLTGAHDPSASVLEGRDRARKWSADAVADAHCDLYVRVAGRAFERGTGASTVREESP